MYQQSLVASLFRCIKCNTHFILTSNLFIYLLEFTVLKENTQQRSACVVRYHQSFKNVKMNNHDIRNDFHKKKTRSFFFRYR